MKNNFSSKKKWSELAEMDIDGDEGSMPGNNSRFNAGNNDTSFIKKTHGRLARFLGFGNNKISLEEEVADLIEEHDPEGTQVGTEERSILQNVFSLSDTNVQDVMVPRADIVAVDHKSTLEELKNIIIEKEHTRIPVYKDSLDNVIGFIHIKDLVSYLGASSKKHFSINSILRNILFVPPSMKVIDLLVKMQARRVHVAIVLDEYGGTCGLVSLEDLVEEIIGDIEDEHDIDEYTELKKIDDYSFEVSARMPVEVLEKRLHIKFFSGDETEEFDTLGGLVFYLLGHVPEKGEIAKHKSGIEFEVIEADARKVSKLLVRKAAKQ